MARASQLDSSDILTAQGKPTLHVELSQRSGADYFSNVVCFNLCEETDDPMTDEAFSFGVLVRANEVLQLGFLYFISLAVT